MTRQTSCESRCGVARPSMATRRRRSPPSPPAWPPLATPCGLLRLVSQLTSGHPPWHHLHRLAFCVQGRTYEACRVHDNVLRSLRAVEPIVRRLHHLQEVRLVPSPPHLIFSNSNGIRSSCKLRTILREQRVKIDPRGRRTEYKVFFIQTNK